MAPTVAGATDAGASVSIRPFTKADQQAVFNLWLTGFDETIWAFAAATARKSWTHKLAVMLVVIITGVALAMQQLSLAATLALDVAAIGLYLLAPYVYFQLGRRKMRKQASQGDMADISTHYTDHPSRGFWVAELGGKVVGCTGLHVGASPHPGIWHPKNPQWEDNVAYIYRMSTDASYRRKGIGSKLLAATEAHASSKGCRALQLVTAAEPAKAMYRHNGFKTIKTETMAGGMSVDTMEKATS